MSLLEVSCSLDFYEKVSQEHDQCNQRQEALSQVNELRMHKRWVWLNQFPFFCFSKLMRNICLGRNSKVSKVSNSGIAILKVFSRLLKLIHSFSGELARKHAEMLSKIQTRQQSVSAERQKFIIDAITSKDID